jgi:hypothetical protein
VACIANSVYCEHCPGDPTCRAFGFVVRDVLCSPFGRVASFSDFVDISHSQKKFKIFLILADGFKLNILVEVKPVERIPLTILASVGQGKWRREEERRKKMTVSPGRSGISVCLSDCVIWQRDVSSLVGFVWAVVV